MAAVARGSAQAGSARQAMSALGLAATVAVMIVVTRLTRRALSDALSSAAKLPVPADRAATRR